MTACLVILVGVLAAGCRSGSTDDSRKIAPEGSANLTPRDPKIDVTPKAQPVHTAPETPPAAPAAVGAFEAEVREGTWALATEEEIKHRFSTGIGKLDSAECKKQQCLLTMSGTEEEMAKTLAAIETEEGLRGYADHIILDGPVMQDGKMIVRAYAVFDRRAEPN